MTAQTGETSPQDRDPVAGTATGAPAATADGAGTATGTAADQAGTAIGAGATTEATPAAAMPAARNRKRKPDVDLAEDAREPRHSRAPRGADLPENRLASRLLQGANRAYTHVYHRLDVFAPCRLPATGAAIIVCNHTSGLDPHLVQSPCKRLITWMMAKEYYDLWYLKPVFQQLGVIPVTRSGRDTSATREAMRALKNGQLLGIFPEGRIENSREMLPFQTGVALMAMKTGVPVYPAYLDGTQRNTPMLAALLRPQRARVTYGDAITWDRNDDSRDGLETATAAIRSAVQRLQDEMDKTLSRRGL